MSGDFTCPKCGSTMEVIGQAPSNLRVCPSCKVLQWDDGEKTQTRYPQLIDEAGDGEKPN